MRVCRGCKKETGAAVKGALVGIKAGELPLCVSKWFCYKWHPRKNDYPLCTEEGSCEYQQAQKLSIQATPIDPQKRPATKEIHSFGDGFKGGYEKGKLEGRAEMERALTKQKNIAEDSVTLYKELVAIKRALIKEIQNMNACHIFSRYGVDVDDCEATRDMNQCDECIEMCISMANKEEK